MIIKLSLNFFLKGKYQQDDVDAKNISDTGANSSNQDQNKPAINKKKKKTKQLLFSTSLNMGL